MNRPAPCMLTSHWHKLCFALIMFVVKCGSRSVQWQSAAVSPGEGCRRCFSWGLNLGWLLNTLHLKWWTQITAGQKFRLTRLLFENIDPRVLIWSMDRALFQLWETKILISSYSCLQQPASALMNYYPQIICSSAWFLSRRRSKEAYLKAYNLLWSLSSMCLRNTFYTKKIQVF